MKTDDEILELYFDRKQAHGGLKSRQMNLRDHYNGDIVVPLPEIDSVESAAVANLLAQGLDQTAMRISSLMPDIVYPPEDPTSERSRKYARVRRQANFGWWEHSDLELQLGKRARHLIGYSQNICQVRWDFKTGTPKWVTRDPLTAFPANMRGNEDFCPANIVFGFERSMPWIQRKYPNAARRFAGAPRDAPLGREDRPLELIEYIDHEEQVLIAVRSTDHGSDSITTVVRLESVPNLIGRCNVTVGERISLDDSRGQFDGMLGMYQQQAKLMALEVLAVQKGIFPDTWLISNPGESARIITEANGLTGQVGKVKGGTLQDMQMQPGFMTNPAIDRLERAQRLDAGIPAEFGGESGTNMRTARRGAQVLSAVVDFNVAETQKVLAGQMTEENKIAVAEAKAYGGDAPKSFYVNTSKAKGKIDYIPNKHFTTDNNTVSYSQVGSDVNALVIAGGQRVQLGTMSKRDFMEIDPLTPDPEKTADAIVAEQLEDGLLTGLAQQAATGQLPPADLAKIAKMVRDDRESLADAVTKVAEERQAETQAAQQGPVAAPGAPPPGQAVPGEGAQALSGGAPPAPPSVAELLGAIG